MRGLNYGMGTCRVRTVRRLLRRTKCRVIPFRPKTSVCIVGAYAMAGVTSEGSERVLRGTGGVGPRTVIITANYCMRANNRGLRGSRTVSLILKGGRGVGVIRTLTRCTRGGPNRNSRIVGVGRAGRCRRLSVSRATRRMETCVGIRSKYGRFYACYVVPCTENHIEDQGVRDILGRIHTLTRGKCGRIILAKVRLDSCKISFPRRGGRALLSLVHTIRRVRKVEHVHLKSLRPKVIAERFTRKVTTLPGMYPRFRLSLRDNYSRALREVGHECEDKRCERHYRLLERICKGPTLAASIVMNFPRRSRRRFQGSCSFISDVHFCRARVFGCSEERKAGTTTVSKRLARTRGSFHDRGVVRLRRHRTKSCRGSVLNGGLRMLVRRRCAGSKQA